MTMKTGILGTIIGVSLLAVSAQAGTIKIGFNIPLTGEIPKVGEESKFAAEMLKELGVDHINRRTPSN